MNGRQLADAVRVRNPDLKVLFINGYAENAVVGSGRLERGMHVLTKLFSVDVLASRIKEMIERGVNLTQQPKKSRQPVDHAVAPG